jgi:hypothetical protein
MFQYTSNEFAGGKFRYNANLFGRRSEKKCLYQLWKLFLSFHKENTRFSERSLIIFKSEEENIFTSFFYPVSGQVYKLK